jgi:hypothetical protein
MPLRAITGKTVMMNTVLTLTLSAALLARVPVCAVEQEKDRCSLKEGSAEKS